MYKYRLLKIHIILYTIWSLTITALLQSVKNIAVVYELLMVTGCIVIAQRSSVLSAYEVQYLYSMENARLTLVQP